MYAIRKFYIFLILASLLKLLGCKEKPVVLQDLTHTKDSLSELLSKSMDDYNNRPIYKILTVEIIDQTSDENLVQVISDNLNEKLPKDNNKEYQTVLSWNISRQAIYATWLLEYEVYMGGFNQYFLNSSGTYAELTPKALKLIGATEIANLVAKANKIFKQEYDKKTKQQDAMTPSDSRHPSSIFVFQNGGWARQLSWRGKGVVSRQEATHGKMSRKLNRSPNPRDCPTCGGF